MFKRIDKYFSRKFGNLKTGQKVVLSTITPTLFFVIFYPMAKNAHPASDGAFDLEYSWFVWAIYLIIVGYLENKIFSK